LRNLLIKANTNEVKRGNPPLITFDQFIEIFEEGEDLARPDWGLARDLVLIRMVEQLHAHNWFAQNQEALEEVSQLSENEETVIASQE
jgi:CRISPR-associated protein Cst1